MVEPLRESLKTKDAFDNTNSPYHKLAAGLTVDTVRDGPRGIR
jgi:hypothetical protein